jgi:hypothetical protein
MLWKLNSGVKPFPWPNDQGTLAELIIHVAGHYTEHLPALEKWLSEQAGS